MGVAVNPADLPVQTQKHVLRKLRRNLPITEETHRQTEDQRLVVLDNPGEIKTHIHYYVQVMPEIAVFIAGSYWPRGMRT